MRIIMAAILAATLVAPALAAGPDHVKATVRVQTADLDLSTAAGQRTLDRRLSVAMVRLCGMPVFFSRDELADLDSCKAEATKAAAAQIDAAHARMAVAVAARQ
jgi:UrcA family protein